MSAASVTIPRDFHFVFGLRPQREPFHLMHYLCLRSCLTVNAPCVVHLHLGEEPFGPWWERIRPHLVLHRAKRPDWSALRTRYAASAEGRFIQQQGLEYAHEADFIRVDILVERGGIYADIDTLFVRPYPEDWLQHDFTIGEEDVCFDARGIQQASLCNAVMLSRPGAAFVRALQAEMWARFDGRWNTHSCLANAALWGRTPEALTVLPRTHFYHLGASRQGIAALFEQDCPLPDEAYSLHLWEHLWASPARTDFSHFHAGLLHEAYVRHAPTTYARLARSFLKVD